MIRPLIPAFLAPLLAAQPAPSPASKVELGTVGERVDTLHATISMVHDGQRWRVTAIRWDDEELGKPLPKP